MVKLGRRFQTKPVIAFAGFPGVASERCYEVRPRAGESAPEGYVLVKFESDGGRLCVHESQLVEVLS
jgi:hypothetical protein